MKTFIKNTKTSLIAAVAATAFIGFNANASAPVAYANQGTSESLKVQVYQDGHPVEGATVKLFETNGSLAKELTTNKFGRVNINKISSKGPLTVIAQTDAGESNPRHIVLRNHSDRT